jgi:lipopolysaccharide heptosyltransferase I
LKVLILKPSSLGDVIHALPVLRMLKKHLPTAQVFWWIDSTIKDLLTADPDLTGLFSFERQQWHTAEGALSIIRSILDMRKLQFDLIIDLQNLLRSAIVGWLANGTTYIGLDQRRELAHLFYDHAVNPPYASSQHAVEQNLAVIDYLSIPRTWDFVWLPKKNHAIATIQSLIDPSITTWIAICPGARWTTKKWPATYFAQTARLIAETLPNARLIILGTRLDAAAADVIKSQVRDRCVDLTGRTSLPQLIEIIRICRVTISNDSGPMHISAAVGTPVVAVFGPTDPKRTGPYKIPSRIFQANLPCVPCDRNKCRVTPTFKCMHSITPEVVAMAAIELFDIAGKNSAVVST